jgi:hypothetical protein
MKNVSVAVVIMSLILITVSGVLWLSTQDPNRDLKMERQMQAIHAAQTVDDLKPILVEIVRKQRHDYR